MSAFPSAPPRTSFFAAKQGALTGTRYLFLDELRGLAILNMILFHLCWNIDHLLNIPLPWYHGTPHMFGSSIFVAPSCCLPVCVSIIPAVLPGIFSPWGGAAVLITVVTYLAGSETLIVFGILHCMTLCFLCYLLLRPLLLRLPAIPGLVLALMLFLFTYHVPQHFLGIGPFQITCRLHGMSLIGCRSLACCPPISIRPTISPSSRTYSCFLAGYFLGKLPLPDWMRRSHCRPLAWLGQHSLIIYLLHQPILYGAMLPFFPE